MAAIDPNRIPGEGLDPEAVESAARAMRADAEAIRETGGEVTGAWSGLRADYEAPEAELLLRVMDPVRSTTTDFGDDLGRVAAALMIFAAELREIKEKFDSVRADAFAFQDRIRSNPEWEFDQALIEEDTALLGRVNSAQVRLWDAERECANAIRAIDDIKRWHSGVAEGDQYGYGLPSIPAGTEMPWGAPVDKKEHCPMSAAMAVKSAVWDGMGNDVIVSTFEGLGGLIGLGEDGFTMETFTATWGGMGMLIGRDPASGEWAWGNAGDAWLETGKSLVAWDMWEQDPARAFGTAALNVALTVASFGTGAAIKGVATAGKSGQVLAVTGQTLRVLGKAMDPVELATGGAKLLKGAPIGDLLEVGRFSEILRAPLNRIISIDFGPLSGVDVDLGLPEGGGDLPLGAIPDSAESGWDPVQDSADLEEPAPDPSSPDGDVPPGPADQREFPHAGADEGPNSGHDTDPAAELHTGGHVGPKDVFRREMWSDEAYEAIRLATDDIAAIAADPQNLELPDGTTITRDDVSAIKDHVFLREHEIEYSDGEIVVKQFDSSAEQAEAWYRLQDGLGTETDRLWLLHEKTELEYLQAHPGSKYREAHAAANEIANWAKEVGLD